MADREYLFPIPGSTIRRLLDFKAELGETFSDDDATADIMLDLDRVSMGKQGELKPYRWYAKRWKWSKSKVSRAFSGDADYDPWIHDRVEAWRRFRANLRDTPGQVRDNRGTESGDSGKQGNVSGQPRDTSGQVRDSTVQTSDLQKEDSSYSRARGVEFDLFWEAYGKKVDRAKCERKWNRLPLAEQEKALAFAPIYRAHCEVSWLPQCNPSTYLNNERWNDEHLPDGSRIIREKDTVRIDAGAVNTHPGRVGEGVGKEFVPSKGRSGGMPAGRPTSARHTASLSDEDWLRKGGYSEQQINELLGRGSNDSGQLEAGDAGYVEYDLDGGTDDAPEDEL